MGACDSSNKVVSSKQYFAVSNTPSNIQANQIDNSTNKLKLEFCIQNCNINDRYQLLVEFIDSKEQPLLTETIRAHHNTIVFNTCYICNFYFEQQQLIRINLIKNGNQSGFNSSYLGMIVGSQDSVLKLEIPSCQENILISAQGMSNYNNMLMINFIIIPKKYIDFKEVKNKVSFKIVSNGRKVYESESVSKNGIIKPASIPAGLLEPNFEIIFLNSQQQKIVSKIETINSFVQQNDNVYLSFYIHNNEYQIINKSQILQQYSFIDYLKNGVQLGLSIGIDFTSSNGQINDPNSLHRIIPGSYNDYEQAINTCGFVLAFYDYDQLFPVYGFGAIIDAAVPKANMCFNINFQPNPEIHTVPNIINEYRNCLQRIVLAGPTEFCPMIRKEIDTIRRENNPLIYHILMILTDGVIVDQQATIDALVEASFLPFSLIIVGIGNDHFQEMIELDGDAVPLKSSNGIMRMRDIVQFVHFNTYKNNPNGLAEKVLEEIPRQVVEYYSMNHIYPNNLKMAQLRTKTMMNNFNVNF